MTETKNNLLSESKELKSDLTRYVSELSRVESDGDLRGRF